MFDAVEPTGYFSIATARDLIQVSLVASPKSDI